MAVQPKTDREILVALGERIDALTENVETLGRKQDRTNAILGGPEGESNKGIIVRFDRVEQQAALARWAIGGVLATWLAAAATWAWNQITGKH